MESAVYTDKLLCTSLNPYYNGRYSWRWLTSWNGAKAIRLNPYYNGRYSWSLAHKRFEMTVTVLILIIMEDTHGVTNK